MQEQYACGAGPDPRCDLDQMLKKASQQSVACHPFKRALSGFPIPSRKERVYLLGSQISFLTAQVNIIGTYLATSQNWAIFLIS